MTTTAAELREIKQRLFALTRADEQHARRLERLGVTMAEQLSAVKVEIAQDIGGLRGAIGEQGARFEAVSNIVMGNGQAGLQTRVSTLEAGESWKARAAKWAMIAGGLAATAAGGGTIGQAILKAIAGG